MGTHFVQANTKVSDSQTIHQIVPDISNPQTPWTGSAPEATATADYLKRRAPETDTFTVVQGKPDPSYKMYSMDRLVERAPKA